MKVCLPAKQTRLGHREMRFDGRGDDNRVEADAIKHVIVIRLAFNFRIKRFEMSQAAFTDVTHHFQAAIGSDLKLRIKFGPQYPQPTTPTFIGFVITYNIINLIWFPSEPTHLPRVKHEPHHQGGPCVKDEAWRSVGVTGFGAYGREDAVLQLVAPPAFE